MLLARARESKQATVATAVRKMPLAKGSTRSVAPASAYRGTLDRRRALLSGAGALAFRPRPAGAEGLLPLDEYLVRLDACALQIDAVATELERGEDTSAKDYGRLRSALHEGELGRFWVTARGADRLATGVDTGVERSPFARDREDMWTLIPEKSGPIGRALRPNFDDADQKLCLVYSCVNDPNAPASIDTLYALKLLDEGLRIGAKGDRVTSDGLASVAREAGEKLAMYRKLIAEKGDRNMVDAEWKNPASVSWSGVGI